MINKVMRTVLAFTCLSSIAPTSLYAAPPTAEHARAVPRSQSQIQLSFSPVVKQTTPAVVNIHTKRTVSINSRPSFFNDPFFSPFFNNNRHMGKRMKKQVEGALGSGVIIKPDGLIMTNAHVVKGADEITIALSDGREMEANIKLMDEASDLALLRTKGNNTQLPFASLKPSESLEVGDIVLAIGNPFGVGQTVTSGIVSATGRSSLDINDFNFFIQTDAAINPGNSGGPLVALDGGVVGINTAIFSRDGSSLGIGFAIPSEMVASVIAAENTAQGAQGKIIRPWFGISAQDLSSDIAESMGLHNTHGALIKDLHAASPLKKSGIKVGDIVLSINDKPIQSPAEMKFRMATVPIGQNANIKILRQNETQTYKVAAIAPPDSPARKETTLDGAHYLRGASISNINPAVAVELGFSNGKLSVEQGVVVTKAPHGTPAYRVVDEGDILVEINGQKITTVKDVEKALNESANGLNLIINNNGHTKRIILR